MVGYMDSLVKKYADFVGVPVSGALFGDGNKCLIFISHGRNGAINSQTTMIVVKRKKALGPLAWD